MFLFKRSAQRSVGKGAGIKAGVMAAAAVGISCATGCAPATVDGTIGEMEFSKIQTAFYDIYVNDLISYMTIVIADHEYTCEELQAAIDTQEELVSDDEGEVVGSLTISIGIYVEEDYTFEAPSDVGVFKVFDFYDLQDYTNLNDGDLLAWVYLGFNNQNGSVVTNEAAEVGTVELTRIGADGGSVVGVFDIQTAETGSKFTGNFNVEKCALY